MTSPMITVEASWPLEDALEMMKDSGVRHLLVTQRQVVVGLVSLRDLHHAGRSGAWRSI